MAEPGKTFKFKDRTAEFEEKDIKDNMIMGIFAYLSILVLIPLFAAEDSKYARFQANQGIVLCIVSILFSIVISILTRIPFIGWLFAVIGSIIGLVWLVYAVLGIVDVVNGKARELPFIGGIRILK